MDGEEHSRGKAEKLLLFWHASGETRIACAGDYREIHTTLRDVVVIGEDERTEYLVRLRG
jgi:hypothetical protein